MEATLTSTKGQLELQLNCREIILNNWTIAGEKPYNYGQRKTLHHHVSGRESHDWWRRCKRAAWAPKGGSWSTGGSFSGQGFPLRSARYKLQAGPPSQQHHSQKGIQKISSCEKWQGFCLPRKDDWRHREPLKGQTHTISFVTTYPRVLAKGQLSGLDMLKENLGMVTLGRELREQPAGSLSWVIPHIAETIWLRQSMLLQLTSAWGKAIALPTGITLPHRVVFKPDCWL